MAGVGVSTDAVATTGAVANIRGAGAALAACGNPHTPTSNPSDFVEAGGKLFFTAGDGVHGRELWASDGTKAGTVLVKDIKPGRARGSFPYSLTDVGGRLFFTADDGKHGQELWTSDGNRSGTVLVKDINPGADGGEYDENPSSLTGVGGRLFFTADDGTHGTELWTSDGTKAGTVLVKDITPGAGGYGERAPYSLTAVGGRLFFTADDGTHGVELWRSDGTRAGTVLVKDIKPGAGGYDDYAPSSLTNVGGRLFFAADDGTHGRELWRSDGTRAGTALVKDIKRDVYDSDPSSLADVGGRLFFTARDGIHGRELWRSDGTRAGTVLVKDINPVARDSNARALTGVGGRLFFTAEDGTHGEELWTSNGTRAGTVLVKDINPDTASEYLSAPSSLTGVGARLFFAADDGVHGSDLWTSDGTSAGTVLVKDINPGLRQRDEEYAPRMSGLGGRLLFAAADGIHGAELWTSDGTEAGTVLVKDVNQGGAFRVARHGTRNFKKGILRLKVTVAGAGRLVAGPAGRHLIRTSRVAPRAAGATRVALRPTAAGMRKLRHSLRVAHREGRKTGTLKVNARFTFTPCGGTPSSTTRRITLKLR